MSHWMNETKLEIETFGLRGTGVMFPASDGLLPTTGPRPLGNLQVCVLEVGDEHVPWAVADRELRL